MVNKFLSLSSNKIVEETRELQRMRKRTKGINVEELNVGKELPKEEKGKVCE